jgi:23S rRNA (adenine-N6)-dimethyltransferase
MQREAAERFLGQPRETLAAVLLKPWFEPVIVHHFRASDFVPRPGVEVVLLRLRRREAPLVTAEESAFFGDLVTYVYTAWQPTVREALTRIVSRRTVAAIERAAGVALDQTPRALPFSAWLRLTAAVRDRSGEEIAAVRGARERLERQQAGWEKVHRTRTAKRVTG